MYEKKNNASRISLIYKFTNINANVIPTKRKKRKKKKKNQ